MPFILERPDRIASIPVALMVAHPPQPRSNAYYIKQWKEERVTPGGVSISGEGHAVAPARIPAASLDRTYFQLPAEVRSFSCTSSTNRGHDKAHHVPYSIQSIPWNYDYMTFFLAQSFANIDIYIYIASLALERFTANNFQSGLRNWTNIWKFFN